jgi:hypothetical protein
MGKRTWAATSMLSSAQPHCCEISIVIITDFIFRRLMFTSSGKVSTNKVVLQLVIQQARHQTVSTKPKPPKTQNIYSEFNMFHSHNPRAVGCVLPKSLQAPRDELRPKAHPSRACNGRESRGLKSSFPSIDISLRSLVSKKCMYKKMSP